MKNNGTDVFCHVQIFKEYSVLMKIDLIVCSIVVKWLNGSTMCKMILKHGKLFTMMIC